MKKRLLFLTVFMGALLFLNLTPLSLQVNEGSESDFEIRADGTVRVDGFIFESLSEYVRSDYFRIMGKRCLIKGRSERPHIEASTADCTLSRTNIQNEYWPSNTYTIPIVFHVISKTDGTGNISNQRIYDQVDVLNEDYRATSGTPGSQGFDTMIQFELAAITRTANNTWHNDQNESQYKQSLGWDQDNYLNVYVNSASGYLGYAYLPQEWAGDNLDGVVILYESVGGRNNGFDPYDQGRTLVHEVGHYLGLLHTFEGNACYTGYTAGDLIADTNSENTEHYGCSDSSTCGTLDPIHNYMNYTDDDCMWKFTSEQANRTVCSLVNYRPDLAQSTPGQPSISGNVYDSNGQGINGVTLTFSNGGGTATTDSNGDYSQTVNSGWSGTVTPTMTGYTFSPSSRSYSNVNSNLVGQNYKATGTTTNPTISGTVTTTGGSRLAGVTLTFSNGGGTATSDSSGNYSQTVSSGWSGTATPSLSGYTFSPSSRSYTNVTSSQSGQNYTATGSSEVMNGGMEDGTTSPDYWWPYNNDLTRETGWIQGVSHGGSRSIKIINSTGTTAGWHSEDVNFSNAYPTTLTFNAWAKAEDVASGGIFALDFYVEFEDGSSTWYYDNLRFSHGTHDWEKAESTKTFDKGVRKVRPYCLLYSTTGTAWFDDVSVSEGGGGDDPGLLNPDMEDGNRVPDYWLTYDNDFSRQKGWKRNVAHSGRRSLMIKNSKGKDAYWQGETVSYSSPYPTSLTLGGWAKATKVKGQGIFAIRFYIEFEDGTSIWYDDGLRFSHGTHGWEQVESIATFSQGITKIRPYCILHSTRGYAWFDDVYANRN